MHDFIAIGDTVIDAFIRLEKAEVSKDGATLSMAFGDKIPYHSVDEVVAVGNSANAAVSAARLGLNSALITNLGTDNDGDKCLAQLEGEKVGTTYISRHAGAKTNYHYVLWYNDDRTILVKHEAYEYKFPNPEAPKWLYLSSLGEQTADYHQEIKAYLTANPEVKFAFQPGTFQMLLGRETLKEIYQRSNIFFCNVEEAARILEVETLGISELLKRMHALGPKTVVITDGPRGAYAYDGEKIYHQLPYPDPKPPLERTGAGDAFSSTTVVALALGLDLPTALKWGAVNSMSVVQHVGAQKGLLSREKIEEYLKTAPSEFQTKILT